MRIVVKLFASLSSYLPADAYRNQAVMEFVPEITPAMIMEQLGVPTELVHLVLINGIYVPASKHSTRQIKENDELAIFPPVAGG